MLKLKKIRLLELEEDRISSFSMNQIMGGSVVCSCGCKYASSGGSSSADNNAANFSGYSPSPGYNSCGCTSAEEQAAISAFWGKYA